MRLTEILTSIGPAKCAPYTLESRHLVVDSTRIPLATHTPFKNSDDGSYYTLSTVVAFMEHMAEPHSNYVKQLSKYWPDIPSLHRNDRSNIKLFFEEGSTDQFEDFEVKKTLMGFDILQSFSYLSCEMPGVFGNL